MLGAPDARSAQLYAETLTSGDPSWLGPLAGVSLDLPVYHIAERMVKEQFDAACYGKHIEPFEAELDVDRITEVLQQVRRHR